MSKFCDRFRSGLIGGMALVLLFILGYTLYKLITTEPVLLLVMVGMVGIIYLIGWLLEYFDQL